MSDAPWSIHPTRRIVEVNTATVEGYVLEDIPEVAPGIKPGIVLVSKEWQPDFFLMRKHAMWGENEYFEEAEKIIKEKKIPLRNQHP